MTYIAFDPGITTGCAIHLDDDTYSVLVIREPSKIWELFQAHNPTITAVENFAAGGLISSDGQQTIRLVGAIELACYIKESRLIIQHPKERYPFMDQARTLIKQQKKVPISHEVDALSHLLLMEHRLANGTLDRITQGRRTTWK